MDSRKTFHLLRDRSYPAAISLVVPMYDEEPVVQYLRRALTGFLPQLLAETEIILVNDGSSDRTLDAIGAPWLGYPQWAVLYEREPRVSGETKYSSRKMASFAWRAATLFSTVPLQASIVLVSSQACLPSRRHAGRFSPR